MAKKYNVLILGASYGSLLSSKLLMAGHSVTLVCRRETAELINVDYCNAVALPQLTSRFDLPQIIRHALDAFWHDIDQKLLLTTQADSLEGFYSDSDSYFDSLRDEEGRVFL